jgi:asparagine synthase (glutamine-hydrolysing)
MCGICGFVGEGTRSDLIAMADALKHRGPDGAGYHIEAATRVHLGHRRLAILDLPGGVQPMWNEDGQVGVVFNGEIYNHLDLRRQLQTRGHIFQSDHSDTEVLVHGYEEWGEDLPAKLNGMFAFAIYDRRQKRMFLARDRFGKKPLYYTQRRGLFAFSSELTSLAEHPEVDSSIDPRSLRKCLAYNFLPAPNALYRGVRKLPGGHLLTFDLGTERLRLKCFWRFRIEPVDKVPANAEMVWADELRHLLSQAVRRRLISDVPLGLFLSGGIDSTAILAFAAEHMPCGQIKTFSIGFQEPSYDESSYARLAAQSAGSTHHERILHIHHAWQLVPEVLDRLDEPIGDPSILPTFLLAQFARQHITVALSGDGGDELFAGYDTFHALRPAQWYDRLVPRGLHPLFRFLVGQLPLSSASMSLDFRLRTALRGLSYPRPLWNAAWLGSLEPNEIAELTQAPIDLEDLYAEALAVWEDSTADNLIDRTLEFYTRLYLQDDILTKVDRATMLNSLEARSPFLDNDVVEFARRLPAHFKYRKGQTKYLLKRMLRDMIPAKILQRKKKGFGIPLTQWLRDWTMNLDGPGVPYFNDKWVQQRWREHRAGKADHRYFLWYDLALRHHVLAHASRERMAPIRKPA